MTTNPASITLSNGAVVKVGDVVLLRNGDKATITRVNGSSEWPIIGDVASLAINMSWALDGRWDESETKHRWDIDLAALATPGAQAVPVADPLDGLPVERENMLAERQRLLDRKFAGDMTPAEAQRLAFIRYGLDVWVEAERARGAP